uniref:Uncharacterized protein n=1 Tax=Nelumbo nucifera TaxID=4432 RepID=A0A822ZE03_NELNU|nr:TPA_asm: hypothetical protein HUJ06_016002 [Nelumbo nucifera]
MKRVLEDFRLCWLKIYHENAISKRILEEKSLIPLGTLCCIEKAV